VRTKQSAPPFSLRELLQTIEQGGSYSHPALGEISSRGHQINLRTVGVNSGSLLAGGRLLSIRDMLRPPLLLEAAGTLVIEETPKGADTIASLSNLFAGWLIDGAEVQSSEVSSGTAAVGNAIATARVDLSRRFKIQSPAAEATIRVSMQTAMRVSIEKAILAGTGTLGQPPGLINEQAIPSESGAATVATLLEDVQTVLDAGAPVELVSIIASAADFKYLLSHGGTFALNDQGGRTTTDAVHNIGGIGIRFSPHLSTGQSLTGDFSRLTVGYYGAPELLANPFIYAAPGGLRLQAWQHAGCVVDQVSAFVRRIGLCPALYLPINWPTTASKQPSCRLKRMPSANISAGWPTPWRRSWPGWSSCKTITQRGEPFPHLLFHYRLAWSGWAYGHVIHGGDSSVCPLRGAAERPDCLWWYAQRATH
jgi:hypothetical protein